MVLHSKMLFDSNESHMLRLNPNHRIRMKKDIARWDYLLSDSELAKSIFNTSFDFNYNKILNYGYPRNEWLINNSNNNTLINDIKTMNNIPLNKKLFYMLLPGEIIIIKSMRVKKIKIIWLI